MRYFIFLAYDGTYYHGWQRQPNAISVQEKLEDILQIIYRSYIPVVGAGRTDTGVHARLMVAHFDSKDKIDTSFLTFKFNCLLPPDICVYTIVPVTPDGHARFSALERTYHYYLYLQKNPFIRPFACRYYYPLDFNAMNKAAEILLNHDDFGSFCKTGSDNKTNICHIKTARWIQTDSQAWYFEITADRFLRNMVRAIVGTLIEIGKGRINSEKFEEIILRQNRSASGESMPACGLFLENIIYPDHIFLDGKAPDVFNSFHS